MKPAPAPGETGPAVVGQGNGSGRAVPARWRLCRIAGHFGRLGARGDLAMVCSRSGGPVVHVGAGKARKESQWGLSRTKGCTTGLSVLKVNL
jgi:hypothetical protein